VGLAPAVATGGGFTQPGVDTWADSASDNAFVQSLHQKYDEPEIKYWPEVRWWLA